MHKIGRDIVFSADLCYNKVETKLLQKKRLSITAIESV